MADEARGTPGALPTGLVLPPADFEKSGRPIPRPYWDAVRVYTFHCPLDLPVGNGTEFEWEDDPMPRYVSYEQMIARDAAFAFWANDARQRFTNLSMHVRIMRDTPRDADEKIWQWADRAYALIAAQTGADLPDPDLSRLIDGDYDILHDDERCRIWWHWAEPHWAIKGYCPNATTTCLAQRATVRLARTPAVRRARAGGSIFDPQDRNSFIRSGAPQARMINR